jgi:transketolase
MRTEFAQAMVALYEQRQDLVFITMDLGYRALEGVARTFGARFVNAGVAEQNAVSVAAGLAREGQLPWLYSMAVFTTLRPYAQIRDNVCLHKLPVKLVGNGGGYGYGIMGATHHALEDVGAMRALPNLRIFVPLVDADVTRVVDQMAADPLPNYLRLNTGANLPEPVPPFAPWRKLKEGGGAVVIAMGPIVQSLYEMGRPDLLDELEIWTVGTLPLDDLPPVLRASIRAKRHVITMEEHYRGAGLGEALSHSLLTGGVVPARFHSLHATGYPSGRYGSQLWHQEENALAGGALVRRLEAILRD